MDKYPELCLEWDKNKNLISPNEVTSGSGYKVWWICPKGHSYLAGINKRTGKKPTGCPYCSGKKILSGFNDLSSKFPEIAKEWDRDLNQISPTEVGVNSQTK